MPSSPYFHPSKQAELKGLKLEYEALEEAMEQSKKLSEVQIRQLVAMIKK